VVPGVIANVIGDVANIPVLEEGGRVAAMVNGGKKTVITKRTGMVGINLQIIQVDTGRVVGAPTCQGTFTTENATQLKHGFGVENSQAEYQASALDQAGQAALNDAVAKIWEVLRRQIATNNVVAMLPSATSVESK
jgi:curli biogenesis system outer membrane secretion channel CsgG